MAIPKLIHIVWIGDETKRPDRWIDTWKQLNPDYEVRVWGNDAVTAQSWMLGEQIKVWLGREINGAADIIRWEILFRHGGLAFDADSACIRPLEDWLIEPDGFAAWENEILRPGLIAAGALGFAPNHPLVAHILKDIFEDPNPFDGMAWQKLGPQRITDTLRKVSFPNLTIYPSHYFFPRHHSGFEYSGTGPIFARQFWGSTHRDWGIDNPDAAAYATARRVERPAADPEPTSTSRSDAAAQPTAMTEARAADGPLVARGFAGNFYLQRAKVTEIEKRLPFIRALCLGKTVLHVGCTDYPVFDPNRNLHIQIHDVCRELDGLDTDLDGMATLARHVPGRYYGTARDVEPSYDLLLMPETIEHVHNIETFLREIDTIRFNEILITAPCLIGWSACFNYHDLPGWRADLLSKPDDYIEEIHPDHKAWFTPYTLANCIEQFTPWRIQDLLFLEGKRMTAVRCSKIDAQGSEGGATPA